MYNRHDIRSCTVDLSMNEALKIDGPVIGIDGGAIEIECQDIVQRDEPGCHVPRQQKPFGIFRVPDADMSEGIEYAFIEKDMVSIYEVPQ